jgi:hypothetical protein
MMVALRARTGYSERFLPGADIMVAGALDLGKDTFEVLVYAAIKFIVGTQLAISVSAPRSHLTKTEGRLPLKTFLPYKEVKEAYPEARAALAQLLGKACFSRTRKRYIYVNNRLEGSAPLTIAAVLNLVGASR